MRVHLCALPVLSHAMKAILLLCLINGALPDSFCGNGFYLTNMCTICTAGSFCTNSDPRLTKNLCPAVRPPPWPYTLELPLNPNTFPTAQGTYNPYTGQTSCLRHVQSVHWEHIYQRLLVLRCRHV